MKKNKLAKKDIVKCAAVILIAVLALSAIIVGFYILENRDSEVGNNEKKLLFEDNGKKYYLRNDIETVLVMGLDKYEGEIDNSSYRNTQCSDFMMLLVFDHGNKTCSAVHINRDTMTQMYKLGEGGVRTGTVTQQITLAHSYGSGLADSCVNTQNAVSGLLCGIPIDYYAQFTMDAIAVVNDMVGGVTVEVIQDLTEYDPALKKGETVTLTGEQAEYYVRHRWYLKDSTNMSRMERQRQYLTELLKQIRVVAKNNENFSAEALLQLSDYMFTNCTPAKLEYFFDKSEEYEIKDIRTYTGETKINIWVEFYANEEDIKKIVAELFCETEK